MKTKNACGLTVLHSEHTMVETNFPPKISSTNVFAFLKQSARNIKQKTETILCEFSLINLTHKYPSIDDFMVMSPFHALHSDYVHTMPAHFENGRKF